MPLPPGVPVTHRAMSPKDTGGLVGARSAVLHPFHPYPPGQGGDSGECTSHYHTTLSLLLVSLGTRSRHRCLREPEAKRKMDVAQRSSILPFLTTAVPEKPFAPHRSVA